MYKKPALFLGILQAIVAIGAIPAGLSMIFEPDGSGVGMSLDILSGTPFTSFFIPGLFLFVVNGLFNVLGAVLSFTKNKYAGMTGLVLGNILILWIAIQAYLIGFDHFLQLAFLLIGIIEIILSFVILRKT